MLLCTHMQLWLGFFFCWYVWYARARARAKERERERERERTTGMNSQTISIIIVTDMLKVLFSNGKSLKTEDGQYLYGKFVGAS